MNDYHNDTSRVSNSMLSLLRRSPELYKLRYLDGIVEETKSDAMVLGSLVHCLILEFDKVTERYAIAPVVNRRTKVGKQVHEEFIEATKDRMTITMEQMDTAMAVFEAVERHSELSKLRKNEHLIEHRIDYDWTDGTKCRSLLDLVTIDGRYVLDIKTTQDASPDEFAKSVVTFGYHRQAAMYVEAVEQSMNKTPRFIFAAVSTKEPYSVGCYELDEAALNLGRLEVDGLIEELKQRTKANDWTSEFTKGINTLTLPRWYQWDRN